MDSRDTINSLTPGAWVGVGLAGYALAGGGITLLGWALDQPRLTDWDNSGISQMPNNALGVMVAGAALLLQLSGRRQMAALLGTFVGLIGVATLFEYLSGIDLGIDRLLIYRDWGQRGTLVPGRMGLPGATSLMVIGIAILLAQFNRTRRFVVVGGLLTVGIAMLSLVGHLFGADTLYTIPKLTTIARQTSTMLLALGIGLMICVPERQPMKSLLEDSGAGLLVRRALPGVIVLPIVMGWLAERGQAAGLFDGAFAASIMALSLMALLTALLWWAAVAVRTHEVTINESRNRLAGMLGSITDAFMTFDKHWRYIFVNEPAETRLRMDRKQLLGANMWDVFPDAVDSEAYRQLHRAMSERISVEYEVFYPPWQRWFADRAYPTAEGGLAVYSQDITARKQIEERLREAEGRMQLAMSIAEAGTWDFDLVTGTNHWSDSHFTLLGYEPTPDRLATHAMWRDALLAEDLPKVLAEWERAERERDVFRSEHRFRRADNGKILWANAAGRFFFDPAGKAVRFVGVFYDINDRKRNEEELRQLAADLREADRRKDEFLATLAHELRNPLAPMRSSLEIMKRAKDNATLMEQARATMERQMSQMVRLIDDLLDLSRISRNKLELRKERVELASIIHHAVEACAPLAKNANHELTVALPAEPIFLSADPVRLAQVFGNLLTNACKYTPQGGRIWLTVERLGSEVMVSIKDTGLGIPPEMIAKVFEMFTQIDRAFDRSQGGLGIGLTLVKQIVELHGGTVAAYSEGDARGSEFVVRLPALVELPKPQPQREPVAEFTATTARRILVVDDNRDAAESLALLLTMSGHEVEIAYDGVDAVDKAARWQPGVILLDIGLPRMNGHDACRAIRQQPGGNDIVIISLTGWGQEEDRSRSREAGFDGHLVKPVDFAALMTILDTRSASEKAH